MTMQKTAYGGTPSPSGTTTLLACLWGLASSYAFFNAALVTHDNRLCVAALVALVIVWATLERKRWGLMALLGLSAVAPLIFLTMTAYVASISESWLPTQRNFETYVQYSLGLFGPDTTSTWVLLGLSLPTLAWMSRTKTAAEFSRGKVSQLVAAQRAIACVLAGSWSLSIFITPIGALTQGKGVMPTTVTSSSKTHKSSSKTFSVQGKHNAKR